MWQCEKAGCGTGDGNTPPMGDVWECGVPTGQAERYAASWNVSNLRNEENGTTVLRVIGERPPVAGAARVQPNLEDLFLYCFGGNEG